MKEIVFDLKLKVTTDNIQIILPSGAYFTYAYGSLSTDITDIAKRCLLDQSKVATYWADRVTKTKVEE